MSYSVKREIRILRKAFFPKAKLDVKKAEEIKRLLKEQAKFNQFLKENLTPEERRRFERICNKLILQDLYGANAREAYE